ncbi:PTS mannose/fructose/sorbose/N-acetylgalactosamine transporter subunit IIC [[Eubacterium] hominis]|uniref:PTS mannose/fructose/sorbose/N-acetylgalactosamine transporter subunit IIC n=1 Tax=[Eubacterium] hominis TaxID=2764325 RepID=UPI003A4D7163
MFTFMQILLIAIIVTVIDYDATIIQIFTKGPGYVLLTGFLTGLVMGDVTTGLLIGGTMQLMSLGLVGVGGSSIPNYEVGAAVGTAFAIATGSGLETALVIGIPTATLGVQFDVLAKMIGSFWLHLAQKAMDEGKFKKGYRIIFFGNLFGGRSAVGNTYPTLLFLILGSVFVESLVANIPEWLTIALTTVGNVLPALGMALLLKFLPVKGNLHYLILGFILAVYFELPILPIAIIGAIIAVLVYKNLQNQNQNQYSLEGGIGDE